MFRDLDGAAQTFPDSNLKRVAARILAERHKPWRYRPFPFPLFTDKGNEQTFYFDFYVYDNMDMVLKLILVAPRESAEVWDKVGRFKRQYPMYSYELWTLTSSPSSSTHAPSSASERGETHHRHT